MIDKNIFTACLIVKNEQENLQRCLDSIKPYCSQIVIVDTGSNDKTPQIASINNCDLFFHQWNDDFSEARNYALKYAINPWIISIDADEVISKLNIDKNLLDNNDIGGIEVSIKNYLDKDTIGTSSKHTYTRIFRNHPDIRFQDKIHEQIRPSIDSLKLNVASSEVEFLHYGYQNTSEEKKLRNQKLLKEQTESRGDDWDVFYLAESEFSLGNLDTALENYSKIINSRVLPNNQKEKSKIRIGQINLSNNQYQEAIDNLQFICLDNDQEGLRLFVLGAAELSLGNTNKAEEIYSNPLLLNSSLVDINIINKAKTVINELKRRP